MRLYPIPGGLWAGTEADFKKQCKARGIDPKTLPGSREVPVAKADLMEFLNFFAVDVYRTGDAPGVLVSGTVALPDIEALRAQHNPLPGHGDAPNDKAPQTNAGRPAGAGTDVPGDLDTLFETAPLQAQLRLAVGAIDKAAAALRS